MMCVCMCTYISFCIYLRRLACVFLEPPECSPSTCSTYCSCYSRTAQVVCTRTDYLWGTGTLFVHWVGEGTGHGLWLGCYYGSSAFYSHTRDRGLEARSATWPPPGALDVRHAIVSSFVVCVVAPRYRRLGHQWDSVVSASSAVFHSVAALL